MPYGHLVTANVMTLHVCHGHSSIASFFSIGYWQACRTVAQSLCHSRASCWIQCPAAVIANHIWSAGVEAQVQCVVHAKFYAFAAVGNKLPENMSFNKF